MFLKLVPLSEVSSVVVHPFLPRLILFLSFPKHVRIASNPDELVLLFVLCFSNLITSLAHPRRTFSFSSSHCFFFLNVMMPKFVHRLSTRIHLFTTVKSLSY